MYYGILKFSKSSSSRFVMQYGFRPDRSYKHTLFNAQNSLPESLSKLKISLLLLIDFSKNFDVAEDQRATHKLVEHMVICVQKCVPKIETNPTPSYVHELTTYV